MRLRRRRQPRWPVSHTFIDPMLGTMWIRHRDGTREWYSGLEHGRVPASSGPPIHFIIEPDPPKRQWWFDYPREGT